MLRYVVGHVLSLVLVSLKLPRTPKNTDYGWTELAPPKLPRVPMMGMHKFIGKDFYSLLGRVKFIGTNSYSIQTDQDYCGTHVVISGKNISIHEYSAERKGSYRSHTISSTKEFLEEFVGKSMRQPVGMKADSLPEVIALKNQYRIDKSSESLMKLVNAKRINETALTKKSQEVLNKYMNSFSFKVASLILGL